jgi:putative membrane protein
VIVPDRNGAIGVVLNTHDALTHWVISPFSVLVMVAVLATAGWYLWAQRVLTGRGRRWRSRRTVSFLCGLAVLAGALVSPLAAFTGDNFQAAVIQHLLLMLVAPPLLAMGAPMTLALQTSRRSTKVRLLGLLNSTPFKVLTHPLPVWFLYYFVMFAFFLTANLNFAVRHSWALDLMNILFFFASTLFWWPIVGIDPIPHWQMSHGVRLAALLIGVPLESFLAVALLGDSRPAATTYTIGSTHAGAGLLWVGAELFTFLALVPVFIQWVHFEERKAARLDARLDAEMAATGATTFPVEPPTTDHRREAVDR